MVKEYAGCEKLRSIITFDNYLDFFQQQVITSRFFFRYHLNHFIQK